MRRARPAGDGEDAEDGEDGKDAGGGAETRPDPGQGDEIAEIAEEDTFRAEIYALLGRLLMAPPGGEVLVRLSGLQGDDSAFGAAVSDLAAAARAANAEAVKTEYGELFAGLAGGPLQPYASFYLAGGLYRQPLADLRGDMARLGIARGDSASEPEDHIASLCEIMVGLILGNFGGTPAPLAVQRDFFKCRIESWAPRFFADLQGAAPAAFYRPVGRIGGLFMDIERQAFDLAE